VFKLYLVKGADVNAKIQVDTPLDIAVDRGHKEIVKLLKHEAVEQPT